MYRTPLISLSENLRIFAVFVEKNLENRRKPLSIKDEIFLFFQNVQVFTCVFCAIWTKLVLNF